MMSAIPHDDEAPRHEYEEYSFCLILQTHPHRRYFNYEELVAIKDTVLAQHTEWKERVESEKNLKNLKRGRLELASEVVDEEEVPSKSARAESPAQNLPKEACLRI